MRTRTLLVWLLILLIIGVAVFFVSGALAAASEIPHSITSSHPFPAGY